MTNIILQKSPNEDEDEVKINMVPHSSETAQMADYAAKKRNKILYFKIIVGCLSLFLFGLFIHSWTSTKNEHEKLQLDHYKLKENYTELDKRNFVAEQQKHHSLQIHNENKDLHVKIGQFAEMERTKNSTINDFKTLNGNLQAELETSKKQIKVLEERLVTLQHVEQQNGHRQAELESNEKQIKFLEEKLMTMKKHVKEQNEQPQAELESRKKEIQVLEERLVTLEHVQEQNEHLRTELENTQQEIKFLQERLDEFSVNNGNEQIAENLNAQSEDGEYTSWLKSTWMKLTTKSSAHKTNASIGFILITMLLINFIV